MRAVPYRSITEARCTRRRRGQRCEALPEKRWTVGQAMLVVVVAGPALWSAFGGAVYRVSA